MDEEEIIEDVDGCIHSIHVRNFFCHDNLEINLNRNVNFIVGRNGSGKSAILTALVVGLGGRASVTNRGNNLHSFIKKGANSATIEIKIKNSSPKAYKHNVYGDYITIVRTINASGGSSYKVKSASGDIISTKYEEVNSIILAHDIQVDNPISVLNQDDARSFHASDAKKKYSLFRKATNLDQTETNYVRALENCNKAVAIWNRKKDACAELEKEFKKWKTSYEQLQSRDEIENKKQMLQNEYYWSEIVELEKECDVIQTQYDKQKAKMEKLVEKLSKMEQNFGNNNDVIQGLKDQLKEKSEVKCKLEQELRALEAAVREEQAAWRSARGAATKHADQLAREQRKVADLQREIQNIESGDTASQRATLEARVEEARAALEASEARLATARHDAAQAQAHTQHATHQLDQHEQALRRQRDSLKQMKQQLRSLEAMGGESLAVFGAHVPELVQRVQSAHQRGEFTELPRGPIGAYLKVKEKKWASALEHILGGSIQAFCVNSPEDSRKLFEIMGEVYGRSAKPSVTCSKFLSARHDVRRHAVRAAGRTCALDALICSDTVVYNYLVDNLRLEGILLVAEHEDAMRLSANEENVPENCAKIVTQDCTEFHPAPNYRSYGGVERPARYLHVSIAQRRKQLEGEVSEAARELERLERTGAELSAACGTAREHERDAARRVHALLADTSAQADALKHAEAALEQHRAPHHAVLVEELTVSLEKVRALQAQVGACDDRDAQFRCKIDEYDDKMKAVKNELSQVTAACRTLSEEIDQEQIKLDQGVTESRTWQQRVREDRVKLAQVEVILAEKRATIQRKTDEATTLCDRIHNPRDKAIVTNELKKTQLKLSSMRSDGLSKAEVAERLLHVERKYRRAQLTIDRLKLLIDDIKCTTDKHLSFCHRVQTYIARRVQYSFQSILALRGYSGRMEVDQARGTLELVCAGREAATARRAASTASLSGGERSYSTVAFIMALWECVELPFYFMDEFDVFMDNVNRKIVMELLIDHALKSAGRQYVFLTPQDTSAVAATPRITIHLMADPRP